MKFNIGKKKGKETIINISDEPTLKLYEKYGDKYSYDLESIYIDNFLIPKSTDRKKYHSASFGYFNKGDERKFCLLTEYDLANKISKALGVNIDTILLELPIEVENHFINVLNPKGEAMVKSALEEIENSINKTDKLITNDTIIEITHNFYYGYSLTTKISLNSNILKKIKNKLNLYQKIVTPDIFKDFEKPYYLSDFYSGTYYEISYLDLKSILETIDIKIEEYENKKLMKEEEQKERIEKLKEIAKETGVKQEVSHWTVECDDPKEDCDIDMVYEYIMPDGNFMIEKHHTW